jgi:4-aminobutyrate aminotransferase
MDAEAKYQKYVITNCAPRLEPITIIEGKGATVTDSKGRRYVDAFSGISVVNTGHCNPAVIRAAKKQMEQLIHACSYIYHVQPVADLAEKLASIFGDGLRKTFFSNSGAEAVECAVKLARKFSKRHELIALMASFHGRTLGTLSITGQAKRKRYSMGPYMGSTSFAPTPYCYRCPLGLEYPSCGIQCAKMLEDVIDYATSDDVAAFIAEPILGEGGIIVPPSEYFREARKILRRRGILFIADEVQTGFARTGKMFGYQHYGETPDIVATAKGIAGGFPLGACTTRSEISEAFEVGDHLSTFGGNPVSCAAAIANIDYLVEADLPAKAAKNGEYLLRRLKELAFNLVGEVRGKGLMIGLELVKDRKKTPASVEAVKIRAICREKGVLIGQGGVKGNVLRIQPPLTISRKELDAVADTVEEALREESNA